MNPSIACGYNCWCEKLLGSVQTVRHSLPTALLDPGPIWPLHVWLPQEGLYSDMSLQSYYRGTPGHTMHAGFPDAPNLFPPNSEMPQIQFPNACPWTVFQYDGLHAGGVRRRWAK